MEQSRTKRVLIIATFFAVGILVGGYLFRDTQPRSFLALDRCDDKICLRPQELMGLMNSVAIQRFPDLLPKVILETDKSIAIAHPFPEAPRHYVVFPKQDIKDISQLSTEDRQFLDDMFAVIAELIRKENLRHYQVVTNGPGYQDTTYLHFHLKAERIDSP